MCKVTLKQKETLESSCSVARMSIGAAPLDQSAQVSQNRPPNNTNQQSKSQASAAKIAGAPAASKLTKRRENRIADFLVCAAGINVCFLLYGLMQEQIYVFIKDHANDINDAGEKKGGPITAFILVSQSITNALVAWGWMKAGSGRIDKNRNRQRSNGFDLGLNYRLLSLTAACYACAMTCSNESLNYVSYPTATLAKSCKLLPTMIAGILVDGRNYSRQEWIGAACLMTGIVLFNLCGTGGHAGKAHKQDSVYGLILLFFSLSMDGCLSWCQGMLKRPARRDGSVNPGKDSSFRAPTSLETMLWTNVFAAMIFGPYSLVTGQYENGMYLLSLSSNIGRDLQNLSAIEKNFAAQLFMLNLLAAAGQFFVFYTLDKFSPTVCTTLTTTRKFFSILLSVSAFGHQFNLKQWGSVILVFGGLYAQIVAKVFGNDNSPIHQMGAKTKLCNPKVE